jgi:hypothetical protein
MSSKQQEMDQFKANVREYVQVNQEIARKSREMGELRKRKRGMDETIMGFMVKHQVEECQVSDGRLQVRTSKRVVPVKKEVAYLKMVEYFEGDASKADALKECIDSARDTVEKQVLAYNVDKRARAAAMEEDVSVADED